jgi:hypothetical protein
MNEYLANQTFNFQNTNYAYYLHPHNTTYKNERAVELSIALNLLDQYKGSRILEVGNVLSHYIAPTHIIVDKYERHPKVINQDIIDYKTPQPFNLIISISTIEHIGVEYEDRRYSGSRSIKAEPEKALTALNHLKTLLAPNGKLFITIPLGFNPYLNGLIHAYQFPMPLYYLKRISANNEWVEIDIKQTENAQYGSPFPCANVLAIGILTN